MKTMKITITRPPFFTRESTFTPRFWVGMLLMVLLVVLHYFNSGLAFAILAGVVFSRW